MSSRFLPENWMKPEEPAPAEAVAPAPPAPSIEPPAPQAEVAKAATKEPAKEPAYVPSATPAQDRGDGNRKSDRYERGEAK